MEQDTETARAELFALVWERPSVEVARELGISDVALAKRCRQLQVPKPPRGYWARVAAGQTPRRPPLPAYRAELTESVRRPRQSVKQIRLSPRQREHLDRALEELAASGADTAQCQLCAEGLRSVSAEMAAKLLIVIQNQYHQWLEDAASPHAPGRLASVANLVAKLQPHATAQVLLFRAHTHERRSSPFDRAVTLRATDDCLARLVQLSRVARGHGLAYVAADLSAFEYAWSVTRVCAPRCGSPDRLTLCVSAHAVWVRGGPPERGAPDSFESAPIQLRDIGPLELLEAPEQREQHLPERISRRLLKPYAPRLQALLEGRAVLDALASASYDVDGTVPDDRLALFDRVMFSGSGTGPFTRARAAWGELNAELERWEQELESAAADLCRDVLGIGVGDIVVFDSGARAVRVELEGVSLYTAGGELRFSLWGRRFRKDGRPGKRTEYFGIAVENDLAP